MNTPDALTLGLVALAAWGAVLTVALIIALLVNWLGPKFIKLGETISSKVSKDWEWHPCCAELDRHRVHDKLTNGWMVLYEYRHRECGTVLTDGPTGGCSVNAVCRKCNINFGTLPGYWGT